MQLICNFNRLIFDYYSNLIKARKKKEINNYSPYIKGVLSKEDITIDRLELELGIFLADKHLRLY